MFLDGRSFPHRKKSYHHDRPYRRESEISDQYALAARRAYGYDPSLIGTRIDPRMKMFEAFAPPATPRLKPEMSGGLGLGPDRVGGLNIGAPGYRDVYGSPPSMIGSQRGPPTRAEERSSGAVDASRQPHRTSRSDERRRNLKGTADTEKHVHFHNMPAMSPIRGPRRHLGTSLEESLEAMSLQDAMFQHRSTTGPLEYQLPPRHHLRNHPIPQSMAGHRIPEPHAHWPRPAQRHCVAHCRGYDGDDTKEHDCHAHLKAKLRPSSPIHHGSNSNSNSKKPQAVDERREYHRPSPTNHYPQPVEEYYTPLSSNKGLWYDPIMEGPLPGEEYWYGDALHGFYPR